MQKDTERIVEDAELVRRCRSGDAQAWQRLVEKYARLVHYISVRHGLAPQEVDDVGQEVFIALAQHINDIDQPERVSAWLSTTARRFSWRALQLRRREAIPVEADLADSDAVHRGVLFTKIPTMSELFADWATQESLQQAIQRLTDRCRELIYRLFLDPEEPSYDVVSQELQIPKGSIGPTRIRCLQQLRERLEELGYVR